MEKLAQHIEALIFAADSPITFDEIQSCLEEAFGLSFSHDEVENAIQQVIARYGQEEYAIEVIEIGGGYQFMSKGSFHPSIAVWLKQTTRKRLSQAALETLSIIAYKQPVTKNEIELIRGVNCDYTLQKLLEKELVSITGRSEGPGRPLLYGTSSRFMDYFGLKNLNDLPKLKDFREPENEAGERTPIEETREEQ